MGDEVGWKTGYGVAVGEKMLQRLVAESQRVAWLGRVVFEKIFFHVAKKLYFCTRFSGKKHWPLSSVG